MNPLPPVTSIRVMLRVHSSWTIRDQDTALCGCPWIMVARSRRKPSVIS